MADPSSRTSGKRRRAASVPLRQDVLWSGRIEEARFLPEYVEPENLGHSCSGTVQIPVCGLQIGEIAVSLNVSRSSSRRALESYERGPPVLLVGPSRRSMRRRQ